MGTYTQLTQAQIYQVSVGYQGDRAQASCPYVLKHKAWHINPSRLRRVFWFKEVFP